jgi:hypothetical protein
MFISIIFLSTYIMKRLPPEIIDRILLYGESRPSLLLDRKIRNITGPKTKSKLLNCENIIKNGSFKELRVLYDLGGKCFRNDLISAVEQNKLDFVKFIVQREGGEIITSFDIVTAIILRDLPLVKILYKNIIPRPSTEDFLTFSTYARDDVKIMGYLLDHSPNLF